MNGRKLFTLAMFVSIAATLCFIAAQPRFGFLPPAVGKFVGTGLVMVSAVFWAKFGFSQRSE